ncbi:hypothetical protein GCM10029963_01520 [Micromonospora andamanensis]
MIVANADDVVTALKCTGLRHMDRRDRLTGYLRDRIEAGTCPVTLPPPFSAQETAWYLQGAFFNTAIVQMSEAMAHVLLALATRPELQRGLDDDDALDRVVDETLRVYPLFGVAHRITSAPITLPTGVSLPAGSVLLFNYPAFHRGGRRRRPVRSGPVALARARRRALHPVRRAREPGLPGPRRRAGDDARRDP